MANCPCCSDILLRHLSSGKLYLLCQSCRTQIPVNPLANELHASDHLSVTPIAAGSSSYNVIALKA